MTRYEYLKSKQKEIKALFKAGYIGSTAINHIRFYEQFLNLNKRKSKMQCYQEVADNNGVSLSTIIKAVKKMSEKM